MKNEFAKIGFLVFTHRCDRSGSKGTFLVLFNYNSLELCSKFLLAESFLKTWIINTRFITNPCEAFSRLHAEFFLNTFLGIFNKLKDTKTLALSYQRLLVVHHEDKMRSYCQRYQSKDSLWLLLPVRRLSCVSCILMLCLGRFLDLVFKSFVCFSQD